MEFCQKVLFEARKGGYHVYRVPSLLMTAVGTVLATAEARRGHGGDYDANDVLLRRSTDGGATWTPPAVIAGSTGYGPGPISNFVPFQDRSDGTLQALFCHDYRRAFHLTSTDDGATWSRPEEITPVLEAFRSDYPWVVAATGPGHGIQLRNGRLVVPVWLSDGSAHDMGPGKRGHRPSCVGSIYSDDHGRTWRRGDLVARTEGAFVHPNETVAVELADGRVLFNMRSESAAQRRMIAVSPDGATRWSVPTFDPALLDPVCMGSIVRLSWPKDGVPGRILFANPDNLERTMTTCWGGPVRSPNCDRKRLTVQLSYDDGRTWRCKKVIEAGASGYSDLAVDGNGQIFCLYESGSVNGMFDDRWLVLAKFDLEWLTCGADSFLPDSVAMEALPV